MAATEHSIELAQTAAQAASDKLGTDITIIDVSEQLIITDCFVVVTAANERQVGAIQDAVEEAMHRVGVKPVRREGAKEGRWVLLDFVDVVAHIQHTDERNFYDLPRLWRDCPQIPFVDKNAPAEGQDSDGAAADGTE